MAQSQVPKPASSSEYGPQVDFLFKVVARYDSYINSTNVKASLIIAWNGVVLGFVFLKYDSILTLYRQEGWVLAIAIALLSLIGFSSIVSNLLVFRVISPFLQSSSNGENSALNSLLFFGTVASMSPNEYASAISTRTEEEILEDLSEQSVTLAHGLKEKMLKTKQSIFAIYAGLLLMGGLLLLKALTG